MKFKEIIRNILKIIKLVWDFNPKLFVLIFLINIISGFLFAPTAFLNKMILDQIIGNIGRPFTDSRITALVSLIIFRALFELERTIFQRISDFIESYASDNFEEFVDMLLINKSIKLDLATMEDPEFVDRYEKMQRQSRRRIWGLFTTLPEFPRNLTRLLTAGIIIFEFKPIYVLVAFLIVLPQIFVNIARVKRHYDWDNFITPLNRLWGNYNRPLTNPRSLLEVKILNIAPYLLEKIKKFRKEIISWNLKIEKDREKTNFFSSLPSTLFYLLFEINLTLQVIASRITVGSLSFYTASFNNLRGSIDSLMASGTKFYENYVYILDVNWFMEHEAKIKSGSKQFPNKIIKIEFKNVWFKYKDDQEWIIKNINMEIGDKENIAIVGENGAGKSTLIKLLCRFYDPQKGQILVNGIDLKEFELSGYWKHIGVLPQQYEQFAFSARESIGLGKVEDIDNLEKIKAVAKLVDINDQIDLLKFQYETPLMAHLKDGVDLSGGQWQRIVLARMILRNADLTILDEPTSNVDSKAEEEIFGKILELTKDKNLVLISHRFSTVRKADKIIVLKKGEIEETGSHEQLIEKRGLYEELFNLQAKAYQ